MKPCFELVSNLHFHLTVKQRQEAVFDPEYLEPRNVSWSATLGVPNICIQEPMFQISNHFEFIWLGFESLKVDQLLFSWLCTLHIILGSPVWHIITFDQLTKILKFLLHYIVNFRDLLCFKFQLMTNPFDMFSNAILNGISNYFLLVSVIADWLVALFVAL